MYSINGRKVTRDEFMADARGFASGDTIQAISFTPFNSPIDGKEITGIKTLEEHNRRHKVQQVGHEYDRKLKERKHERNGK